MKVVSSVQLGLIVFGFLSAGSVFAADGITTTSEVSSATDAPAAERADYKDFKSQQKHKRSENKKWFSFGVCVGQNLAQQGVVITAGQKLDSSYKEYIKAAKATCKEQLKPAASPSPSPAVDPAASPTPSPSASPSVDDSASSL